MSVKSILSGKSSEDKEFQNIVKSIMPRKEHFKTLSNELAFSKYPIIVSGEENNTYEATLVGTAFDYLARAMVAHVLLDNKEKSTVGYVAVKALKRIESKISAQEYKLLYNKTILVLTDFIDYIYRNGSFLPKIDSLTELCTRVEWDAWYKYLQRATSSAFSPIKDVTRIIDGAIYLAELEHIFRSGGRLPEKGVASLLESKPDHLKRDLKGLCEEFERSFINKGLVSPDSVVVFNPKFGVSSYICRGADADIYIDGTLYDFKTSKTTGYKWQESAQLTAYFLLDIFANSIEDIDERSDLAELRIDNIAFYRARFGQIEFCKVDDIIDESFDDNLYIFGKHMLERFTRFLDIEVGDFDIE